MWRCREQQQMVGCIPKELAKFVPKALVGLVGSRHSVCLVHDYEIPTNLAESGQDIVSLGEVEGGDDPVLFHPLVDAELFADVSPLQDEEPLIELFP